MPIQLISKSVFSSQLQVPEFGIMIFVVTISSVFKFIVECLKEIV
jgi:hypothetical protein